MHTPTYFDHNAPQAKAPELSPIPAADDPLTQRIRKAIDVQRTGIEVDEIELPRHAVLEHYLGVEAQAREGAK